MSLSTHVAIATGAIVFGASVAYFYNIFRSATRNHAKNSETIRVLFFPDAKLPCPKNFADFSTCTKVNCSLSHDRLSSSFGQVIEFLSTARKSLDIAVFIFTSPMLSHVVKDLLETRKVKVRIIVDKDNADLTDSMIPSLRDLGIPVRINVGRSGLMHHKFAVVDGKSVMTGSFNWTQTAVTSNNENLIVVENNHAAAGAYLKEFNRIWALLS